MKWSRHFEAQAMFVHDPTSFGNQWSMKLELHDHPDQQLILSWLRGMKNKRVEVKLTVIEEVQGDPRVQDEEA